MSLDMIKTIIAQYPMCQHTHKCPVPNFVKGQLGRRKLPGQIWQMDYIGPLLQDHGCKYVCTTVDTYSGYLIPHPCKNATHHSTICIIDRIILYYVILLQIQANNGSHF